MADIPTLEPAPETAPADATAAPRKRRWILVLILTFVALAAAAGVGGWLLWGGSSTKAKVKGAKAHVPEGPALFVALDPPFVTNFEAEQAVRFLQLSVEIMTHDPATVEVVKVNDPVIRNDLLLLFSNQKYADIATSQGKERLRAQALAAVRKVVSDNGGRPDRVEAVYFTSFVMQ